MGARRVRSQIAVKQQYVRLFPDILDLYSNDFIAEWNAAINNLQLRPLLAEKPKYLGLAAASAPTSPIKSLYEFGPRRDGADP